jgi:uncharacterized damage-inducible protein DinB
MTIQDLQTLYDYSYWANGRLFAVISQLSTEEFSRPLGGSYGSIRNTLVHALSAEWGWLSRCGGPQRGARLNGADYPTADSLIQTWSKVEEYVRQFLSELKNEDVGRHATYLNDDGQERSMPLGELMQHAAIHNAHHRGQVALLLRMLGYTPGNFDLLFYYAEKHGVPAF